MTVPVYLRTLMSSKMQALTESLRLKDRNYNLNL